MGAVPFRLLDESTAHPLRDWSPAIAGLVAAVAATWLLVPDIGMPARSWLELWFLATRCTIPVFFIAGLAVWLTSSILHTRPRHSRLDEALGVACLATWLPPLVIFFRNRSWIAAILGAAMAATITRASLLRSSPAESSRTVVPALATAILLQFAALAILINDWHAATFTLAAAASMMVWIFTTRNLWPRRTARMRRIRIVPALLVGVTFSAGGLSPYLARGNNPGAGKSGGLLDVLLGGTKDKTTERRSGDNPAAVVIGESYPGVILWPDTEKRVLLVPPPPARSRTIFAAKTVDSLSIPFYGAYYFFKAPGPLPRNPFVTHGDPVALTFRSTDLGPLAMEARQNFIRLIPLSCCTSIAVLIRNGDRRPGALSLELQLRNTTIPEKPTEILGPEDIPPPLKNHPLADERIVFPIPPNPFLREFDEVTVRFLRSWPGADRSSRIAISRFIFNRRS